MITDSIHSLHWKENLESFPKHSFYGTIKGIYQDRENETPPMVAIPLYYGSTVTETEKRG